MNEYMDIINLSRPQTTHVKLGIESRASQFSPYAALTGYGERISEVTRITNKKIELTEDDIERLSNKLNIINEHIKECPKIAITYFIKDSRKVGGKYTVKEGNVKQIDSVNKLVVFKDNSKVNMNDILSIKGDIFP